MEITPHTFRATVAGAVACLCTLLFSITPAEAQQFGVKAGGIGVGASEPVGSPSPLRVARGSGFSLGAFMIAPVNDRLGLQVEALFTRRSFDLTNNPDVPSLTETTAQFAPIDSRFRADYLEIPVLARIPLGDGNVSAQALVGPALAINLRAELEDRVFPQSSNPDLTAAVRDLDIAMVLGGAVTVGSRFVVEGRYNVGLLAIQSHDAEVSVLAPDSKWRSYGLSAGVIF